MTLGEKIQKLRQEHNFSQETLSEKLNVSVATINDWESDKSVPSINSLKEICTLFAITADSLVFDNNCIPVDTRNKLVRKEPLIAKSKDRKMRWHKVYTILLRLRAVIGIAIFATYFLQLEQVRRYYIFGLVSDTSTFYTLIAFCMVVDTTRIILEFYTANQLSLMTKAGYIANNCLLLLSIISVTIVSIINETNWGYEKLDNLTIVVVSVTIWLLIVFPIFIYYYKRRQLFNRITVTNSSGNEVGVQPTETIIHNQETNSKYSCKYIKLFESAQQGTCRICFNQNCQLSLCEVKNAIGVRRIFICGDCLQKFKLNTN